MQKDIQENQEKKENDFNQTKRELVKIKKEATRAQNTEKYLRNEIDNYKQEIKALNKQLYGGDEDEGAPAEGAGDED